jgi:DNA-binding response OmpR family regulator
MFNILVVEDDFNTRRLMCTVLERYGYNPIPSTDGIDALEQLDKKHVDLVILDIMMPRMDGYEFTRVLREGGNTLPILMVTAKETPADKHKGFIIGTDDYMTKPVDEEEMILRIAALLRRSRIVSERKLTVGSTVLYYDAFTVRNDGEAVGAPGGMELPQKEFLLLYKLLSYPGKIFTRIQLMDEIWGADSETGWETVTVHVGRLRKRFEGWQEFEIEAVRGLGYKAVKKI